MPRNASGVYTLPSGNPVITDTTIDVSWANGTMDDIRLALTESLSRSGDGAMLTDLDMGGFDLINVGAFVSGDLALSDSGGVTIRLSDTSESTDEKNWDIKVGSGLFVLQARSDDLISANNFLEVLRTGIVVDQISTEAGYFEHTGNFQVIGSMMAVENQSGNYTLDATHANKCVNHLSGGGPGDTYTIPANASVAYALGTVLTFVNSDNNSVDIAITSDTMTLAGTVSTGTRTLAQNGIATATKITSTSWIITGVGLT